jgi:hypothetical protein
VQWVICVHAQYDEATFEAIVKRLPDLPPNARYIWHRNSCYDWGTWGWLLQDSGMVQLDKYRWACVLGRLHARWCIAATTLAAPGGRLLVTDVPSAGC